MYDDIHIATELTISPSLCVYRLTWRRLIVLGRVVRILVADLSTMYPAIGIVRARFWTAAGQPSLLLHLFLLLLLLEHLDDRADE